VGSADGEGQEQDDSLVHKSFEVNEYLVKANMSLFLLPGDGEYYAVQQSPSLSLSELSGLPDPPPLLATLLRRCTTVSG